MSPLGQRLDRGVGNVLCVDEGSPQVAGREGNHTAEDTKLERAATCTLHVTQRFERNALTCRGTSSPVADMFTDAVGIVCKSVWFCEVNSRICGKSLFVSDDRYRIYRSGSPRLQNGREKAHEDNCENARCRPKD